MSRINPNISKPVRVITDIAIEAIKTNMFCIIMSHSGLFWQRHRYQDILMDILQSAWELF